MKGLLFFEFFNYFYYIIYHEPKASYYWAKKVKEKEKLYSVVCSSYPSILWWKVQLSIQIYSVVRYVVYMCRLYDLIRQVMNSITKNRWSCYGVLCTGYDAYTD